jgi:hypothetical protein
MDWQRPFIRWNDFCARCPVAPEGKTAKRPLRHLPYGSRRDVYRVILEIDDRRKRVRVLTIRHGAMESLSDLATQPGSRNYGFRFPSRNSGPTSRSLLPNTVSIVPPFNCPSGKVHGLFRAPRIHPLQAFTCQSYCHLRTMILIVYHGAPRTSLTTDQRRRARRRLL